MQPDQPFSITDAPFPVRLTKRETDDDGTHRYWWVEQQIHASGRLIDVVGGRQAGYTNTHTLEEFKDGLAVEINNRVINIPGQPDRHPRVWLRLRGAVNDDDGKMRYEFELPPPLTIWARLGDVADLSGRPAPTGPLTSVPARALAYEWTEVYWDYDLQDWVDLSGGMSFGGAEYSGGPAYEMTGRHFYGASSINPKGWVVLLHRDANQARQDNYQDGDMWHFYGPSLGIASSYSYLTDGGPDLGYGVSMVHAAPAILSIQTAGVDPGGVSHSFPVSITDQGDGLVSVRFTGAFGSFVSSDGKVVSVAGGMITSIEDVGP